MFQKSNWKKEFYKEDLINVLVNGFIAALLGGILAGVLDYLFSMLSIYITIGMLVLVYLIGIRMRKGYYSYHILYPVLSIFFLLLGFFFSLFAYYAMNYMFVLKDFRIYLIFTKPSFYLAFLLMPVEYLISGFNGGGAIYVLFGIVNLIVYAWAFFFTFRMVKGRN